MIWILVASASSAISLLDVRAFIKVTQGLNRTVVNKLAYTLLNGWDDKRSRERRYAKHLHASLLMPCVLRSQMAYDMRLKWGNRARHCWSKSFSWVSSHDSCWSHCSCHGSCIYGRCARMFIWHVSQAILLYRPLMTSGYIVNSQAGRLSSAIQDSKVTLERHGN